MKLIMDATSYPIGNLFLKLDIFLLRLNVIRTFFLREVVARAMIFEAQEQRRLMGEHKLGS